MSLQLMWKFIIAYHDAIVSALDTFAFILVTPELIRRSTWERLRMWLSERLDRVGKSRWIDPPFWAALLAVPVVAVVLLAIFHRNLPPPRTALVVALLAAVMLVFQVYIASVIIRVITLFVELVLRRYKLAPAMLVFGIGLFLLARILAFSVSVAEPAVRSAGGT